MRVFDLMGNKIVLDKLCAIGLPYIGHYRTTHVVIPLVFPGVMVDVKISLIKGVEHDFELNSFGVENTTWILTSDNECKHFFVDNSLRIPLVESGAYKRFEPYLNELEKALSS